MSVQISALKDAVLGLRNDEISRATALNNRISQLQSIIQELHIKHGTEKGRNKTGYSISPNEDIEDRRVALSDDCKTHDDETFHSRKETEPPSAIIHVPPTEREDMNARILILEKELAEQKHVNAQLSRKLADQQFINSELEKQHQPKRAK